MKRVLFSVLCLVNLLMLVPSQPAAATTVENSLTVVIATNAGAIECTLSGHVVGPWGYTSCSETVEAIWTRADAHRQAMSGYCNNCKTYYTDPYQLSLTGQDSLLTQTRIWLGNHTVKGVSVDSDESSAYCIGINDGDGRGQSVYCKIGYID